MGGRDDKLILAEGLEVTGATAEYFSTDVLTNIKWLRDNRDVRVQALVTVAYVGGNTVEFEVQAYSTSGTAWVALHNTGAIATADLVAGHLAVDYVLPRDTAMDYTSLRVSLTEGDVNFSAGKVDIYLAL